MASSRISRSRRSVRPDFFPFLAVLACIIGTLVLVIIMITTSVLGTKRSITVVARDSVGGNVQLRPHYVEVRKDGVLLHPGLEFVSRQDLRRRGTPLRQLLDRVAANRAKEYVIVAVRPDGFSLFDDVREQVEGRRIHIGYEPIAAEWKLKVSQ